MSDKDPMSKYNHISVNFGPSDSVEGSFWAFHTRLGSIRRKLVLLRASRAFFRATCLAKGVAEGTCLTVHVVRASISCVRRLDLYPVIDISRLCRHDSGFFTRLSVLHPPQSLYEVDGDKVDFNR